MSDKKTEALKLALKKAFDLGKRYWSWADSEYSSHWKKADAAKEQFNQLVEDTIREALAEQPAQQQEPDYKALWQQMCERCDELDAKLAQQQEPVAWITKNGKGWLRWHKPEDSEKNKDSIPLYTAPTSKPWVGLTQTDLVDCDEEELKQARYWENKLKEKNT